MRLDRLNFGVYKEIPKFTGQCKAKNVSTLYR